MDNYLQLSPTEVSKILKAIPKASGPDVREIIYVTDNTEIPQSRITRLEWPTDVQLFFEKVQVDKVKEITVVVVRFNGEDTSRSTREKLYGMNFRLLQ
jgi:hypothetical protein